MNLEMFGLAAEAQLSEAIGLEHLGQHFLDRVGGHLAIRGQLAAGNGDDT
ncbi:unannotated protein [freshwater metagenome]|uniref:Unannotated protein n=1 Tax=freshwater metagenome TaxID=449393 RepID=A0A6J6S2K8_9ZZZZ